MRVRLSLRLNSEFWDCPPCDPGQAIQDLTEACAPSPHQENLYQEPANSIGFFSVLRSHTWPLLSQDHFQYPSLTSGLSCPKTEPQTLFSWFKDWQIMITANRDPNVHLARAGQLFMRKDMTKDLTPGDPVPLQKHKQYTHTHTPIYL